MGQTLLIARAWKQAGGGGAMCQQEGARKVQQSRLQAPAREENVNAGMSEAKFTRERSWKRFTPLRFSAVSTLYSRRLLGFVSLPPILCHDIFTAEHMSILQCACRVPVFPLPPFSFAFFAII